MSKLLKRLNDNQNKVADTNGIMKLQAWDYGVAKDLTNKQITATVANASGFLFDIDLVSNGTEIDLDFKDSQLQQLTPDTYYLEIKVTDADGDVSVFPTEGYATFTINKNLHATEGALVPQITFDTVLENIGKTIDRKVAVYTSTISKGDRGATGPAGKDGYMPVIGGRNLYLNSRGFAGDYGKNGNVTVTVEPFDSTTNMWHIVATQGTGGVVGIYQFDYGNGKIPNNSDWAYSVDIKGIGKIVNIGIEDSEKKPIKGTIGDNWSRISQTGHINEPQYKTISIYFDTTDSPLDVYIKLPKLEAGNVATDWTPAPEDVQSDINKRAIDTSVVHNTGNETVAGNKTFSGNTTMGGTLMTDSGWKNMSLASGVKATVARYRLLNGVVYIQVLDVTADVGKVFATLPAGYRPPHQIWESYFSANKSGNFLIDDNGEVSRASSTTSGTDSGTKASFEVSYPID